MQIQEEIKMLRDKILEYPYVGNPLGYTFLREKKLRGLRIYFLIYEEEGIVLFVDISDKKEQQVVINKIKKNLEEYKGFVKKASLSMQLFFRALCCQGSSLTDYTAPYPLLYACIS